MESDWMLADIHMTGYPSYPESEMSVYWHRDGLFVACVPTIEPFEQYLAPVYQVTDEPLPDGHRQRNRRGAVSV
jgi:hypothetical protein